MPIYEYQCAGCGRITEKVQKFSEPPLTVCPQCGGSLSKLISTCSFHLKGSGWYVTDYSGKQQTSNKPEVSKESQPTPAGDTTDTSTATPPRKIK
jgi:putative FmdB family regulatory protein